MPKRSRLAKKIRTNIVEPDMRYPDRLITEHKKCPKNDHSNTGRSGIRWVTVSGILNGSGIQTFTVHIQIWDVQYLDPHCIYIYCFLRMGDKLSLKRIFLIKDTEIRNFIEADFARTTLEMDLNVINN
jgi:hypothetical protein